MTMINTTIGINDERFGRFFFIIYTVCTFFDAATATNTGFIINNRIPLFCHLNSPFYFCFTIILNYKRSQKSIAKSICFCVLKLFLAGDVVIAPDILPVLTPEP
ncbi:hypothetical protein Awo_c17930 [Acetobacterium woodii DSM 1030]|uniref:Uncharacterized protein n=1 Tax=Acetobacterium woodii (strain ATCC 29683 / DSM 1030 / JCM 2381 / KCTC 1655 / WB1) TaxID=931626 RepID=H6LIJ9_ACEWD|nr:hypothetical protein Awo_c17930 [Acetobacterium woodii DSM 1030]